MEKVLETNGNQRTQGRKNNPITQGFWNGLNWGIKISSTQSKYHPKIIVILNFL